MFYKDRNITDDSGLHVKGGRAGTYVFRREGDVRRGVWVLTSKVMRESFAGIVCSSERTESQSGQGSG